MALVLALVEEGAEDRTVRELAVTQGVGGLLRAVRVGELHEDLAPQGLQS